jgi:(S)-ureidoglycine aminohydrolase
MEISALTRSVVKNNHAIIAPDGYINSCVPGWTNCTVNVIINEAMGAKFSQLLTTLKSNGEIRGETQAAQIFFYVVKGRCHANVGGGEKVLTLPVQQRRRRHPGTQFSQSIRSASRLFCSSTGDL